MSACVCFCVSVCVCLSWKLHQDTFRVTHSSRGGATRPHSAGFRSGLERYVFLFQKMLLIVKKREEGYLYKYHAEVSLPSLNQCNHSDFELQWTVHSTSVICPSCLCSIHVQLACQGLGQGVTMSSYIPCIDFSWPTFFGGQPKNKLLYILFCTWWNLCILCTCRLSVINEFSSSSL